MFPYVYNIKKRKTIGHQSVADLFRLQFWKDIFVGKTDVEPEIIPPSVMALQSAHEIDFPNIKSHPQIQGIKETVKFWQEQLPPIQSNLYFMDYDQMSQIHFLDAQAKKPEDPRKAYIFTSILSSELCAYEPRMTYANMGVIHQDGSTKIEPYSFSGFRKAIRMAGLNAEDLAYNAKKKHQNDFSLTSHTNVYSGILIVDEVEHYRQPKSQLLVK